MALNLLASQNFHMRQISVFIAGSKKLTEERNRLKILANNLNVKYFNSSSELSLNMSSFEDLGDNQNGYDNWIRERADWVIFVIDGEMGGITEKELKIAAEVFRINGRPKISTFVRVANKDSQKYYEFENTYNKYQKQYDLDYYIEYSSLDNLEVKAKERIDELVNEYVKGPKRGDKKTGYRKWQKIVSVSFAILLSALLTWYLLDDKKYIVFSQIKSPTQFALNGITDEFIQEQLIKEINDCIDLAHSKYENIMDEISHTNQEKESISSIKLQKEDIVYSSKSSIRNLFGKHKLFVSMTIMDADSVLISDIKLNGKNGQSITIQERKADYKDNNRCALAIINKSAAWIIGAYSPVISTLYDYNLPEGLDEYQMKCPWNDNLYTAGEREEILLQSASRNDCETECSLILLANYFDKAWQERMNPAMVEKANLYYRMLMKQGLYTENIQYRIEELEGFITQSHSRSEPIKPIPEILMQKGVLGKEFYSKQLIVVTKCKDQAVLYAFELTNDGWQEKFTAEKVNVGVNGFAPLNEKVEGDLKTPSGLYSITMAFGNKKDIDTKIDFIEVDRNHIWVCDTASNYYNKLIIDSTGIFSGNLSNERLFRTDKLYKYAIVIDYNTNPVIKGKGSAIFMHIERRENHKTAGCISLPEYIIAELIRWLDPEQNPCIYISSSI